MCRVLSTTSTHFDFVPWKNRSCVLSRSRDTETYTVCDFESFLSLTFWLQAGQISLSYSCTASYISLYIHIDREHTANFGEQTDSKDTLIPIKNGYIYHPSMCWTLHGCQNRLTHTDAHAAFKNLCFSNIHAHMRKDFYFKIFSCNNEHTDIFEQIMKPWN